MAWFFVHRAPAEQELVLCMYPTYCKYDDIRFGRIQETFSIHHRLESEETKNVVQRNLVNSNQN